MNQQMEITTELENQFFEEFLRFAYEEFYISGWRDRMNLLRGGEYNYFISGFNDSHLIYMLWTIPEILNDGLNYQEVIMEFKKNVTAKYWFQNWLKQRFPNTIFWKKGDVWCMEEELKHFMNHLTFEDLNDIIHNELILK